MKLGWLLDFGVWLFFCVFFIVTFRQDSVNQHPDALKLCRDCTVILAEGSHELFTVSQ